MSRLRKLAGPVALLVAAPALMLALAALVILLLGGDPGRALAAIYRGSLGSRSGVLETLVRATPLLFTGLSVAVAFRCGIWNIGAEGQLLLGMLGSAAVALALPPLPPAVAILISLAAGTAAGAAWAAIPTFLKLKRDVPEVISTIMLNFLAVYLLEYLVRGPLRDPASANDWSRPLPDWARIPRFRDVFDPALFGTGAGRIHFGVLFGVLVVLGVWLWLARSGAGFRIRAVGLNPAAARTAGIRVSRTVALAFLTSGALAGLGGAVEQLAVIARLHRYAPGEPGYGFTGIPVALLGQLHPAGVLAGGLFFGGLSAGCDHMQRAAGVSFHVAYVIQAAVVLALVSLPPLRRMGMRRKEAAALPD